MPSKPTKAEGASASAWYRQPVLWLGMAIFVASLAGCVWMIVLGVQHEDPAVPIDGHAILHMPIKHQPGRQAPPPQPDT